MPEEAPGEVTASPATSEDPTIGRLVNDASRDISTLISKQIELTKSELKVSVKAGGVGIALFVIAAFFAVMSLIMLSVAIAYLIHWNGQGLDLHWAFLCVFGFYLLLTLIFGLIGLKKVKKVGPPEQSIKQAKQTAAVLKR